MSAIFGIINKKENTVDQNIISKVQQTLQHRCTDGSNSWLQDNAFFWHGKLYVHPQQQKEILPLEKEGLVIVADALLFNRDELFSVLSLQKEIDFPDAQLILAAFQKWGKDCVYHLDGEYVFAIWDKQSKELFLVSDHIGFRPVFYYDSSECFIFCSEIKGVVAAKQTPNYFNEEHIIEYHFRQSPPNQTYNKEVFALCGGNTLTLSNNKINIEKYWVPKPLGKYHFTKPEEWFECLRDLLFNAVEKRLNPDVPVGITLSGGLDSTSIACILSELLRKKNKPLYAFSSVLPIDHKGIEQDERQYIEIVNKHCGNIIQTYVEAPDVGPFDNVEEAFELDEYLPNSFFYMDRVILESAKEKNISNLFTGFGGDFWVSWTGYSVIFQLIHSFKFKDASNLIKQFSKTKHKKSIDIFKQEYLARTSLYNQIRKIIHHKEINWQKQTALLESFSNKYPIDPEKDIMKKYSSQIFGLISSGRIGVYTGRFNNRNNNFNMNSAMPLFDRHIYDFLFDMPVNLFVHNGYKRSLIRHSMEGIIPKEIQWRLDKKAYSPNYQNRIIKKGDWLEELINEKELSFIFEKYISKKIIQTHFKDIVPVAGFIVGNKIVGIRIAQAGILAVILKSLKTKKYRFED